MKKTVIALILIVLCAACITFTGCSDKNAIWLEDGQTLKVVDNTLGEGVDKNIPNERTYKNYSENEEKGYVYILPVSEDNPTVRYFASIKQGTDPKLVEITDVKEGDKLTKDQFLSFESFWAKGMEFINDDKSRSVHYTNVVTNNKYCYKVTRNNNITVWGYKYLDVTVTSPAINVSPLHFTIEKIEFLKFPMLLSHKGDSWTVLEPEAG